MENKAAHTHLHVHENNSCKKKAVLSVNKIHSNDLQLWQEFQTGSESAFATIYEQNVALLYSYGLKLVFDKELVKDMTQDLFIELWNSKERLARVQSIKAYLYKSLRRKLIKSSSKQKKRFDKSKDVSNLDKKTPSAEISLIEKQLFDEKRDALNKAITTLSERQREIIYLKFYGRLGYNEIGEIMSLDKKSAYNLMARTVKILKKNLISIILFSLLLYIT
ncbi:sigma-70 family RNA polymerase sigma factor [uncultured Polaribacter sp.]|uniref:RNA polymerase sigma factor n=1 Tax=uncultured Polaribacter sp. TaxID=174711 RepID=UPI0026200DAE|nr:sigma-70 family RNA polymerase sigma factor [uncultured Polaribacter sp.]